MEIGAFNKAEKTARQLRGVNATISVINSFIDGRRDEVQGPCYGLIEMLQDIGMKPPAGSEVKFAQALLSCASKEKDELEAEFAKL